MRAVRLVHDDAVDRAAAFRRVRRARPSSRRRPSARAAPRAVIEIKNLRYISRDIITPRGGRGRSVADQRDRFTISRRRVGDQPVAARPRSSSASTVKRRTEPLSATRQSTSSACLPGGQLDLARGEPDFAPVDPADADLHRRARAHDRVRAHDRALAGRQRRALVGALGRATRAQRVQRRALPPERGRPLAVRRRKKGGPKAAWEVTRSSCCQEPPGGDPAGA